jgi:hypothetical protein
MARFLFRLQPALDLAARQEETERRACLVAARALAGAVASLRAIEARIEGEPIPLERGAQASAAWVQLSGERRAALGMLRRPAIEELARREAELARRRANLEGATCRRSALERLRERRRAAHGRRTAFAAE